MIINCYEGYSQSNFEQSYKKAKSFFATNGFNKKYSTFFVNKVNSTIEISNVKIPIFEVKCEYGHEKSKYGEGHYVRFNCHNGNCIDWNIRNEFSTGIGIPFKNKEDCYTFINLISDLKDSM